MNHLNHYANKEGRCHNENIFKEWSQYNKPALLKMFGLRRQNIHTQAFKSYLCKGVTMKYKYNESTGKVVKTKPTLKTTCPHCEYTWFYKGTMPTERFNVVRSCPRCKGNLTISLEMRE